MTDPDLAFERYGRLVEIVVRVKRRKNKTKMVIPPEIIIFREQRPCFAL